MDLELHKIKRSMHHDVIGSYWAMLQECEAKAAEADDRVLKHQVAGWYKQWNRMTGDTKLPVWDRPKAQPQPALTASTYDCD